jgi:hypothetical protein
MWAGACRGGEGKSDGVRIKVFISYLRRDMSFADRLQAALKAHSIEPLIDRSEIYAFEDSGRSASKPSSPGPTGTLF